jgi:hypothetical protein
MIPTLHKGVDPMSWRIALLILLTTSVPLAEVEPPDEQALSLLNQYRESRQHVAFALITLVSLKSFVSLQRSMT